MLQLIGKNVYNFTVPQYLKSVKAPRNERIRPEFENNEVIVESGAFLPELGTGQSYQMLAFT